MKRIRFISVIIIALIAVSVLFPLTARADELQDISNQLDLGYIEDFINEMEGELSVYMNGFSLKALWNDIRNGEIKFDLSGLLTVLGRLFFKEAAASGGLLVQLIVLSMISLILKNLSSAFGKGNVSALAHGVIYLLLIGIAVSGFSVAVSQARAAVTGASDFLYASLPVLMTILASMGGIGSVSIVHPAMLVVLSIVISVVNNIIFPLIYFSAILGLVSHIVPKFNINKLSRLFKDVSIGALGIMTTLFLAFLSISGIASSSIDGLTVKAAKAAAGVFIPVVGKSLADSLDTVIGLSLVLKNGIGIIGVIIIIMVCAVPSLKILITSLIYKATAALVQPMGDDMLSDALNGLGSSLQMLFAVVAICGLFFFFLLVLMVGMGNITMMFR